MGMKDGGYVDFFLSSGREDQLVPQKDDEPSYDDTLMKENKTYLYKLPALPFEKDNDCAGGSKTQACRLVQSILPVGRAGRSEEEKQLIDGVWLNQRR
jgi:hypothetical protein